MHKYIYALSTIALATISTQAHAGAVALCIEKSKNLAGNYYDSEYFLRHGASPNVDGYVANRAARRDHRKSYDNSTPYCRHNGDKLQDGGYFVVIKGGREKDHEGAHYNRWALGFGLDRKAALKDAKAELRRRDWSWVERKHGYEIAAEDKI